MARFRDLFRTHRLAARDVAQVWVLSLLMETVLLAAILMLHPSVRSFREGLVCLGIALAVIIGADILLLVLIILFKIIDDIFIL